MGRVLVIRKIEEGSRPELGHLEGDVVTVGRDTDQQIPLRSGAVSSEHAVFVAHGGYWFYRDLGSTNGSWINGKRTEKRILYLVKPGDILQIADIGIEIIERGTPDVPAHSAVLVLSRGEFMREFPIPESGKVLSAGGAKADLPIGAGIGELASLVIERRGPALCAFSPSKDMPVRFNGSPLVHTVMLADRDELEIEQYRIILSEEAQSDLTMGLEVHAGTGAHGEMEADAVSSPRRRAAAKTSFGLSLEESDSADEEWDLGSYVSSESPEQSPGTAAWSMRPASRHLAPQDESRYVFENLENKILIGVGLLLFAALILLAAWWILT